MTFNRNAKRSRAVTRSRNVPNANAVSTLPAELLGKIFVEARQSYWESLERDGPNAVGLDTWLYAVCGVCTRWRKVSRETPRLWGFISLTSNSERTMDALRMSASSPLRVRGDITRHQLGLSHFKSTYEVLLTHFTRIQQFSVALPFADDRVSKSFLHPAPILEALCIRHPMVAHQVDLPSQMNSLRTLELFNAIPSVHLPHLPCLTKLAVSSELLPDSSSVHLTWLVRSMQNTPIIEEVLINIPNFTNDIGATRLEAAALPCLSRFCFSSSSITGPVTLFDFLNHPASTKIEYTQTYGSTSASDLPSIQSLLTRFTRWAGASINQICISGDARFGISVFTERSSSEPHITISLPSMESSHDIPNYMDVLSALPLATIPGLTLHAFAHSLSSQGQSILQPFHGVEVLKLSVCHQDIMCDLTGPDDDNIPPMPKLRNIILSECDGDLLFSELFSRLERRRRGQAASLEKIWITECNIDRRDACFIDDLEEFCEVEWDGLLSSMDVWESESESSESSDSSACSLASGDDALTSAYL